MTHSVTGVYIKSLSAIGTSQVIQKESLVVSSENNVYDSGGCENGSFVKNKWIQWEYGESATEIRTGAMSVECCKTCAIAVVRDRAPEKLTKW